MFDLQAAVLDHEYARGLEQGARLGIGDAGLHPEAAGLPGQGQDLARMVRAVIGGTEKVDEVGRSGQGGEVRVGRQPPDRGAS